MAESKDPPRYGIERIRRGLLHFLFGKGISSLAGFVYLVLLVRHLTVAEFAAYSVLQAFVYVFTALTGFGFLHATLRYIPELYAEHKQYALRGFVFWAFGLRVALLSIAAGLAYISARPICTVFGLDAWIPVFQTYLVVVWLRVNNHFLFQILESTLHQGYGQTAFVAGAWIKLILIFWTISRNEVGLENIVWLEQIAEFICMLIFLIGILAVLKGGYGKCDAMPFAAWWSINARRVVRFGLAGYLQQLAIMPYGSAPNRLLAGRFLEAGTTAAFGFSQSVVDIVNRYLPAQLLGGLIRPVVVAKFATKNDFTEVAKPLTLVFRVNSIFIGFMVVPLAATGRSIVDFVSNGKYGIEAALLLVAMLSVLLLESRRFLLDIAIQAVEKNKLLVAGNLALACTLLLVIGLLPWLGAMAIPFASLIGLLASNAWLNSRLKRFGYFFPIGMRDLARVIFSTLIATGLGHVLAMVITWHLAAVLSCVFFAALVWLTGAIKKEDVSMLRAFMAMR